MLQSNTLEASSHLSSSLPDIITKESASNILNESQNSTPEFSSKLPSELLNDTQKSAMQKKKKAKQRPTTLRQEDLAARLKVSSTTIARNRGKANFGEWSKQHDPNGIAWEYRASERLFSPIK